ncbi:acetyltransferase [Streptomyces viridochromogenes DSM 40736]|uniref:Acetyltransferase n=1 Tax=Streptomyces viridochromogenes (strain DSM 40736 / JCM 4977 / BCRC 1201 / Tue 494) TaxID=591159 RepID=D9XFE5_STRVT|nr:GNAT family N-acetyltransferase [Streptomyces viridochromogenes]EFL32648.1 acetyltransferase [Streptomyces viridochromogenes DSM 40736]
MPELTYTRHEGQDAADALDVFLPAYEEIYAEPPYLEGPRDVADFIEHYAAQAKRPGMRLVLAHDGPDVVGFTYGYYLAPDTRWWANIQDVQLPPEETREDGRRTFVIIELAVRRAWRRRRVAATLHNVLLEDVHAERVTLTVRPEPEAAPARQAYEAWGYHRVGTSHPWEDAPLYDCMVRHLQQAPPAAP